LLYIIIVGKDSVSSDVALAFGEFYWIQSSVSENVD